MFLYSTESISKEVLMFKLAHFVPTKLCFFVVILVLALVFFFPMKTEGALGKEVEDKTVTACFQGCVRALMISNN